MTDIQFRSENPDFLEFCYREIWRAAGATEEHARIMGRCISYGDRIGKVQQGMGVFEAPIICLRGGNLDISAEPEIVSDGPSFTVINGHQSSGQWTLTLATETAIEKARESGVAISLSFNHNDGGCFAAYTALAVEQDMVCMATNNSMPLVSPWGGMENTLGAGPLSVASPGGQQTPIFCDIATTEIYDAHIAEAYFNKKPLPGKYLVNPKTGELTDDVTGFFEQVDEFGRLADCTAPSVFATPRNYAINLITEIFSTLITPNSVISPNMPNTIAAWGQPQGIGSVGGSFVMVLDPAKFQPIDVFKDKSDALVQACKNAQKRPGVDEIFLPGERGYRNMKQNEDVEIMPNHWEAFIKIAESFDLDINHLKKKWEPS